MAGSRPSPFRRDALARKDLVRVAPARLRLQAVAPRSEVGKRSSTHSRSRRPERRDSPRARYRRSRTHRQRSSCERRGACRREEALSMRLQERGDGRVGRLRGERLHEAPGREVAGGLVVVEEEPAQELALLVGVRAAEPPVLLGEQGEYDARLRDLCAVLVSSTGTSPISLTLRARWRRVSCRRRTRRTSSARLPRHAERAQQEPTLKASPDRRSRALEHRQFPSNRGSASPRRLRRRA